MKPNDKKSFYVFCFGLLGALTGILAMGWLELYYQQLNFFWIGLTAIAFAILGFWSGEYWWKQIYELHRYKDLPKKNKSFAEVIIFLLILASIAWLAVQPTAPTQINSGGDMQITSPAFTEGSSIPAKYSCQGEGINPPLSFQGVPKTAESLALILHDPDAPMPGGFTHWVVFNLPPTTEDLAENSTPSGVQGKNGADKNAYIGLCPPSGTHHYYFYLYALDEELNPATVKDEPSLRQAMAGHIIGEAQLMGTFSK